LGRNAAAAAAANAKAAKKNAKHALAKQRKAEKAVAGPAGGSSSVAGSTSGQQPATGMCYCLLLCAMLNKLQLYLENKNFRCQGSSSCKDKKDKTKKKVAQKQHKAEEAVAGPAVGSSSVAGSSSGQQATGVCNMEGEICAANHSYCWRTVGSVLLLARLCDAETATAGGSSSIAGSTSGQ
jgi:hypothetical protein